MSLTFDEETGNIVIDFPDAPHKEDRIVTVRPPKYGALKRLRAEREKIANEANRQMEDLPEIPAPIESDDPELVKADAEERTKLGNERLKAITEINEQTMATWWKFVLSGDDAFAGLADRPIPADVDDWPSELLIDFRESPLMPMIVDRMFQHWGKVRSRSGPKA